jgi:PKD domain
MRRRRPRSVRTSSPVLRHIFRPAAFRLEERTLLSTVTWASDVSGDWDNPSMWTGGAVPGPNDDAVISYSDITVTHDTSASDSVNSINCAAALDLTNGSLAIATTSSISGSLTLQAATLSTAGTLTVSGSMTWAGGTATGGGALQIASGAVLDLNQPNNNATETLVGTVLQNAGTVNVLGTNNMNFGLSLQSGAGVANESGGSFTFQANASIFSDGSATYFSNAGSLTEASGTLIAAEGEYTDIEPSFTQTSTGSILGQGGQLVFSCCGHGGGTVDGTVTGAAGSILEFDQPSFNFASSSDITSTGVVAFSGSEAVTIGGTYDVTGETFASHGTVSFTAPITALGSDLYIDSAVMNLPGQSFSLTTLTLESSVSPGTLNGGGGASLTVSGTMTWVGGTVTGFGALNIPSGAVLNLNQPGANNIETLVGAALENAGTVNVLGTNNGNYGLSLQSGAGVENQLGASFNFQVNAPIISDGSATYFTNAGGLTQGAGATGSGGCCASAIAPAFTQTATGSVTLEAGGLYLDPQGTISGTFTGAAGTTLYIGDGVWGLSANSSIHTAGSVWLYNDATIAGAYNVAMTTLLPSGATATFTAPITNLGDLNVQSGSTLNLPGQSLSIATVENSGIINGGGGASLTVSGTMTWVGGTVTGFGALNIPSGATLSLGEGNNTTETLDGVALENAGTAAWSTGTLVIAEGGALNNMPGAVFGSPGNTGLLSLNSGTLGGSGTINANVTNAGQVIPGGTGAAGTLTINGNYTQTATGALDINIGGLTADSHYSQLAVSGAATLGGTINLALINGFQPAFGNTFQVLIFGSSSGNFANYQGTSLASGLFLDPVFGTTSLTLNIDQVAIGGAPAVPLPGISIALTSVVTGPSSGNSFTFSWNVTQSGSPFGSGSGTTFTFTPNVNATYLVTLTVTDVLGGKGTTSLQIVVAPSIFVLDPSAGGALSLSGNASINISGEVAVDSSSSSALSASGNAQVRASVIDVHGGVQKSGNASLSPTPVTGAPTVADPFASLASPSTSGLTNYGSKSLSGNSSATINPGIYSQITISGNAALTMCAGTYIIEGGGLTVSGNASISGTGITIFNAGSRYPTTGGTYGSITLSGNGSYNLSPPTSGTYAGIVIFQSRDNSKALTISGNASGMTGMVYAPASQFAESGNAQLNASLVVDTLTISGNGVADTLSLSAPTGTVAYTPNQIRDAYGINNLSWDGTGQTIAIVDAYDDPSIFQALDAFDAQFTLTDSGPTLYSQYGPASSFLTVLNQYGQATSLPSTDPNGPGTDNWEVEEALDVEWTHAIAPGAQIILVEANSQALSDLMASVATAASQPGVSVVSLSWGFPEGQAVFAADEATYDGVFNVPGVTFVASTGDYGAADPEYPAFSPNVVAVGGTSLTLNSDNSYNSETGWGYQSDSVGAFIGSGGGISLYEPEPAYQQVVQSTGSRTTPDVSLVADPATGAWIADPYNLDPSNPFEIVGGTSLSAPAWAGLVALINQGRAAAGESTLSSSTPTDAQQALYMLPQSDYNAIASGTNGYSAGAGYNLVTGLGTPVANLLVPDLIAYQGSGTTYSGPTVGALQNATLTNTGTSSSSPLDVFSVFDSLTVSRSGFGSARDAGRGGDSGSPRSGTLSTGGADATTMTMASRYRVAPSAINPVAAGGVVGMMPLDTTMTTPDHALTIGSRSRAAMATTKTSSRGTDPGPKASGSKTPVLQAALVDRVLEEFGSLPSLLSRDGTNPPSNKLKQQE